MIDNVLIWIRECVTLLLSHIQKIVFFLLFSPHLFFSLKFSMDGDKKLHPHFVIRKCLIFSAIVHQMNVIVMYNNLKK